MKERIIISGFGGQGALLAGKILCIAAMKEGKNVSHIPSYGAEMRGGTAHCAVVISDDYIASPLVKKPTSCIVFNGPSFRKFESKIEKNGFLMINSTLVHDTVTRQDIDVLQIPALELANKAGAAQAMNMVTIGAFIKHRPQIASIESVIEAIHEVVKIRYRHLLSTNLEAVKSGFDFTN